MPPANTTRSGWRPMIALLTSALTVAGCGIGRQYEVQQQISDRTPIDPSLHELSIDECGTNTEPLTGGYEEVPVGRGFQYRVTITNRDSRIRQFELRVAFTAVDDPNRSEDAAITNTVRLAPGESQTLEEDGWLGLDYPNGISCSAEVWPSLIEVLDPPPDS